MTEEFEVRVYRDENGAFIAEVPSLPGCVAPGKTRGRVEKNIKDAIEAYLASLRAHDEPIPPRLTKR